MRDRIEVPAVFLPRCRWGVAHAAAAFFQAAYVPANGCLRAGHAERHDSRLHVRRNAIVLRAVGAFR